MRFAKFFAAAAVVFSIGAPAALAQETRQVERDVRVIGPMGIEGTMLTINADGKVESRPDQATIQLGVTTEGATAAAALTENARRATALTAALRRAGVAERDIQTSNVSVNPQYVYGEGVPPRITGYQANNTVNAKVRNLDNLGRIIDASVAAGGNNVNGVSFGFQDPDAVVNQARQNAIREARARADLYAAAMGMRVHRVISVSEGGGMAPPPYPMPMMAMRMESADAVSTPVSPGEVETRFTVNVVYELR